MTASERRKLIGLTCASMMQHGIVLLLMGPVLPAVMEAFQISEATAGLMLGMGSLGFTLGPIAAGMIADRAGTRWILLWGLAAEVVLLGSFGLIPSFLPALFVYLALYFAAAFVETAVNVIPALIERQQAGSLMNLVHLFFSVGAFICPLLAGLILKATGDWRPVFWLAALPTALLLWLALRVTFPPSPIGPDTSERPVVPIAALLRERSILLGALALFLYVGAEIGTSNWIVLYLQRELGFATLIATSGLSILWIGIMIGRYLNSLLARSRPSRELVLWAGVGGLAACLALLTARTPVMAYFWLGVIGLCMSGVYPNIMAELNGRNPTRAGAVTGFLTVAAAAGAMIFQPLLGMVAQWLSLPAAIAIPGVLMGLLAVAYLGAVGRA